MLKFEQSYPLSKITTLNIGGPAKLFVAAKTQAELIEAIQYAKAKDMDYLIIGGGSNLLVNDKGVDCLVIKNEIEGIATSKESKPTFEVKVASGTILQELVDYSIRHGLSGLHKLTGIPGTVGGAIYGNAGAYGQTISEHIIEVVALNPVILGTQSEAWRTPESKRKDSGQARLVSDESERARMTLSKDQCNFNYRDSGFKRNHFIILEATFQLGKADPKTLQQEADEVLQKRLIKYPKGIKCPGSFFKNMVAQNLPQDILDKIPPAAIVYGKLPAGYLLEQVGAKGDSLDGISIAPHHANLFINKGEGNATAFYTLAKTYAQKVKQKFGITLEPEVQLINLPLI